MRFAPSGESVSDFQAGGIPAVRSVFCGSHGAMRCGRFRSGQSFGHYPANSNFICDDGASGIFQRDDFPEFQTVFPRLSGHNGFCHGSGFYDSKYAGQNGVGQIFPVLSALYGIKGRFLWGRVERAWLFSDFHFGDRIFISGCRWVFHREMAKEG